MIHSLFFEKSNIRSWLPVLQAHRGFHDNETVENTLASIQKAFLMGYEMSEFDVYITADEHLILHHNPNIESLFIAKTSLQKLKEKKDINTLEQIFEWLNLLQDKKFKLNIELKSKSILRSELEKKTVDLIAKHNLVTRVMISSFNPLSLMWIRFYNKNIYRALLLTFNREDGNTWIIKNMLLNFLAKPHALNLRYQDWSFELFGKIAKKVPVVLWTCNDMQIYKKNKTEIYGIISDEITPQMLK